MAPTLIGPHVGEDELRAWLSRVEAKVDEMRDEMREEQRRHRQTLYGPNGGNGLVSDVRELKQQVKAQGMIPTKTLWAAVTAVATIAAVVVTAMAATA